MVTNNGNKYLKYTVVPMTQIYSIMEKKIKMKIKVKKL